MPVQLIAEDNSEDPRVISLQSYMDGRANFTLHYYYTSSEASFGGQVLDAQWSDLQSAVDDYVNETGVPATEVALRFVHCFDVIPGNLYVRLQICQLTNPHLEHGHTVYDLNTTGAKWYEIKDSAMNPTTDEMPEGPEYLSNFYYKVEPQSQEMECLTDGPEKYVKNLVFPWDDEVLKMYMQNGSPNGGVHFAACSYLYPIGEYASVHWPHGMVIYLSDAQGRPLLNNQDYISLFHNKGADFATMCPPNCDSYILPVELSE